MTAMALPSITATLTDEEFAVLAAFASEEAGLSIPHTKKTLVQTRVLRRLRHLKLDSCQDYLRILRTDPSEKIELVSALTTNVSSFYREAHHFKFFREKVAPLIRQKLDAGGRVRLWSAGCSSGEEPYTLGMEILKALPGAHNADLLILATDIDPKILARARLGIYSDADLDAVSAENRNRFFDATPDAPGSWTVSPELRNIIRFKALNLHADWPMQNAFDAVFCRNVVIYFDAERQRRLWPRFRASLVPNGWLFLGHSERIHPVESSGFTIAGVTIYQKTEPAEPPGITCH